MEDDTRYLILHCEEDHKFAIPITRDSERPMNSCIYCESTRLKIYHVSKIKPISLPIVASVNKGVALTRR